MYIITQEQLNILRQIFLSSNSNCDNATIVQTYSILNGLEKIDKKEVVNEEEK